MTCILRPVPPLAPRGRLAATALGLGSFLTQFDVTAVVVVMPAIGEELGLRVPGLAWVIDAYSLAFVAALLLAGALADRFGRRRSLLAGNAIFVAASLACAVSWTSPLFLIARAVQGVGAAFLVTGAIASIATVFPAPAARARAFGTVGVVSGIAMALGPVLGGAIGSWVGWRWIFLANLPLCALLAAAVPRLVPELRDDSGKPLDWRGVVIVTLALGVLIAGLIEARQSLVGLTAGLASSAALFVLFAVRQGQQKQPMLDPAVFASRSMAAIAALLLAVSVGYWAVLVYLPLFLRAAFGWTVEQAGTGLLAATLPMLLLPPFGARLTARLGWRRVFAAAMAMIAAGGAALAVAALAVAAPGEGTTVAVPSVIFGMAAIGAGAALSHPQLSGAVLALAPADARGMASAVTVVARQGGFAIGVAVLGALAPPDLAPAGFAVLFGCAAAVSAGGAAACMLLPAVTPSAT